MTTHVGKALELLKAGPGPFVGVCSRTPSGSAHEQAARYLGEDRPNARKPVTGMSPCFPG
jgi:hypothetical protein